MAVEYIDSPNAGFVKLGEKVGLSTITPERKRKVKRSDRGIFPISPTSAESYEDADFRPDSRFSQPASAIPNVFDRFRNIPGGARADAEIPFERVISPIGINPNQNPDARQEDADLEEQLRRKSLDFDPVSDYDLSRFDPNSPNFNSTAAGEQAYADVLTGGDFFSSLDRFGVDQFSGEAATISFNALDKAKSDVERAQNLVNKTQAGTRIGNFALDALENANKAQQELQIVNDVIGKRGAAPSGDIPRTVPEQQRDFRDPRLTVSEARFFSGQNVLGSTGGTGFTTNVPKASNQEFIDALTFGGTGTTLDAISGLGSAPTGVPSFSGSVGRSGMFGLPDVRSDIGETPTPTGFSQDAASAAAAKANLDSIDIPSGVDIDIPGGGGSFSVDADAVTVETPDGFVESFGAKDGGKISFMNMKK
jgi:hypothetical protein